LGLRRKGLWKNTRSMDKGGNAERQNVEIKARLDHAAVGAGLQALGISPDSGQTVRQTDVFFEAGEGAPYERYKLRTEEVIDKPETRREELIAYTRPSEEDGSHKFKRQRVFPLRLFLLVHRTVAHLVTKPSKFGVLP